MKLPKKFIQWSLAFILMLSLSFRSGYIHQHGGDTWGMAIRANVITKNSAATWVLSPISYFGWYPYSYPSGEPIFLSGLEQTTTLDIEMVCLIGSTIFGLFGILTMFLLARTMKNDDLFALLVVVVFSTFSWVILNTWNTINTRGLFVMSYPLLLFLILKLQFAKKKRFEYFLLVILMAIAVFSIHRITILLILVVIFPMLILQGVEKIWAKLNLKIPHRLFIFSTLASLVIIFVSQLLFFEVFEYQSYEKNATIYFSGNDPLSVALNLGTNYSRSYNLTAIFAPIGLLYMILQKKKDFNEKLLILISIIAIFFIMDIQYFLSFFPPITALLVGYGIMKLQHQSNHQKLVFMMLMILVGVVSLQILFHLISQEYHILIIIWFVGLSILLFAVWTCLKTELVNSILFHTTLVGLIIIITTLSSAGTHFHSLDEYESFKQDEGKMYSQMRETNYALWVKNNAQRNWISDGGFVNPLWARSEVDLASSYFDISNDKTKRASLKTSFNMSILWESRKNLYEYEIAPQFDPRRADWNIIVRHDTNQATIYKVNWVIFSNWQLSGETDKLIIPFLLDERYVIYQDLLLAIFHYAL